MLLGFFVPPSLSHIEPRMTHLGRVVAYPALTHLFAEYQCVFPCLVQIDLVVSHLRTKRIKRPHLCFDGN